MSELLPCPFCGGEAKSFEHGDVGFVVQCRRCGIWNAGYSPAWSHITEDEFHGFISEAEAIEAWNTRADDYRQAAEYWRRMYEEAFAERTCKVEVRESAWGGYTRHCGNCGADLDCDTRNRQNYCPNCGAKVVGE